MSIAEHRARQHKLRLATCQHFTGIQHDRCKKEIRYSDVRSQNARGPYSFSCIRDERWEQSGKTECACYEATTEEQVAEEEAELQRTLSLLSKNLSSCCEAPIDKSHVIVSGQHKGHGPRFCSRCKHVVMWV